MERWAIEEIKTEVDCRVLAEQNLGPPLQHSTRVSHWLCPFHQDKRTPSLAVYRDSFKCFGCGEAGDQIALIQKLEGYDFVEAIHSLSEMNGGLMQQAAPERRSAVQQQDRRPAWRSDKWQRSAKSIVEKAKAELEGSIGADYLLSRGIRSPTWEAFGLGFVPNVQRWQRRDGQWQVAENLGPAITIPWVDDKLVTALQYRLLEHDQRYHQKAGGDRLLFGLQQLAGRDILIICEGELNAVSIWQASSSILDVVSFGPEDNFQRAGTAMQELARRYSHVVIWADKADRALDALKVVGTTATLLQSPMGMDANDLLQTGQLSQFLVAFLRAGGITVPEVDSRDGSALFARACQRHRALESELEELLSELGASPGTAMEFKQPGHPAHEAYLTFRAAEKDYLLLRPVVEFSSLQALEAATGAAMVALNDDPGNPALLSEYQRLDDCWAAVAGLQSLMADEHERNQPARTGADW